MITPLYRQSYIPLKSIRQNPYKRFGQPSQTHISFPLQSTVMSKINTPAIEFEITKDAFILRAEVPGIDGKDLDIQVSQKMVTISANYQPNSTENQGRIRTEFRYGQLYRQIELPEPIIVDQLQANLKNGILTLTLPKLSAVRPKVIKVNILGEESSEQNQVPVEDAPTPPQPQISVTNFSSNIQHSESSDSLTPENELTKDVWEVA